MSADTGPPPKVADSVVDAGAASMALRLQSVACKRTQGGGGVTCTHEYGICGVTVMVNASARSGLMASNTVTWRCRQAEATSSHGIWVGLESHDWHAVSQTQERADHAAERVA